MAQTDKTEAIAQMTRAISGLAKAINVLDSAYDFALATEKRKLFRLLTELEERLEINRSFIRHLKASEVVVKKPSNDAYTKLDNALAKLHAIDVQTNGVKRVMTVVAALGSAVKATRAEVSSRAV